MVFIKTPQENPDPDEACATGPDAAEGVPAASDVVEGGGVWRENDGLLGVFVELPALDLLGLLLGEDAADGGRVVDDSEGDGGAAEGMGWIEGDGEEGDYSVGLGGNEYWDLGKTNKRAGASPSTPSILSKFDRDSTRFHEEMAIDLISVSLDLGCSVGGPMRAKTERFNSDDEDLVGAIEVPVGRPLFNVGDV
ncbi:hypothetical protein RHSIM_Rhsim01G0141000 [Rhododendron simsii]|uniref:Uncharacterized protein n=1 Tax=Rhododendron simsii TaxID=118357 RepID=A0A834LY96_RHOSS|nr:hypothetical protein RHSIM_Rhsim01G0141000 [Rhododendron simsii]